MFIIVIINRVTTPVTIATITAVVIIGMVDIGVSRCHTTTALINGMMGTITNVGMTVIIIAVITTAAVAMIITGATTMAGTETINTGVTTDGIAAMIEAVTELMTGDVVITGVTEGIVEMIAGAIGMINLIDWTKR